jgi:hypothetical protein
LSDGTVIQIGWRHRHFLKVSCGGRERDLAFLLELAKPAANAVCYDCSPILTGSDDVVTRGHENLGPSSDNRRGSRPWKVRSKAS